MTKAKKIKSIYITAMLVAFVVGNIFASVNDTTLILCPQNIAVYTDINECSALINNGLNIHSPGESLKNLTWELSGATIDASPGTGVYRLNEHTFNEGTTTVTYRGTTRENRISTCSFEVVVSDNQLPRIINKPDNITVSLSKNECGTRVSWDRPMVTDNCTSSGKLEIKSSRHPGDFFRVGTTKVLYWINDGMSFNRVEFSFLVSVVDEIPPELTAPVKINVPCQSAVPGKYNSWNQFKDAGGSATDNCGINYKSFKFVSEKQSGSECPYTVTRTYQIADINGNISQIDHYILVGGADAPETTKAKSMLKSALADISAVKTGNWSDATVWSNGVVPTSADNITINGYTVTIDIAAQCNDIDIQSSGTLNYSGTHTLKVYGNWNNSGTFNAGTSGVVEFTGGSDAAITGTTTFEDLTVNKGSDFTTILNINGSVTVSGGGTLTLTKGLVKINSGGSFTVNPSSQLDIPNTSGIEVNGGTINTGNFTIVNKGLIRISSGTATFGTNSGNSVHSEVDGVFEVSGGTVDIAGRLENTAGGTLNPGSIPSGINISGGTITLSTIGNGLNNTGSLNITSNGDFSFTNGTIVFQNASTATTALDLGFTNGAGTKNISGGTFQFGNGSTPSGSEFNISSDVALSNITSSANADIVLQSDLIIDGTLSLNANSSINLNGNTIQKNISSTGTYNFPLDDGSGNSIPVSINFTGGTFASGAYVELTTTASKHPNNKSASNYLNRYWIITTNGITSPVYNVTASYANGDVHGAESGIAMGSWPGSLPWLKYAAANTTANTITATGVTNTSFEITGITLDDPTVTITNGATASICYGSSIQLNTTATGDPTITYLWSSNPSGFSSTNANPTVSPNVNTTYTVTITDGNGFTASDDIDITVDPLPTATAGGSTTICSNGSATVSGASASNGTILWTHDGSGSLSNATTLTPTYTAVTGDAGNTVTLTMTVTSNNACGTATATATYTIAVDPLPTATAGGSTTICSNSSATVNGASASNGTIQWTHNGSGSLSNATTLTPTYTAVAGDAGNNVTLTMTVTSNNTCGTATATATYTIRVDPLPTATAGGSTTICSNGSATVSGASSSNGTIQWTHNGSGSLSNATTLTPTYTAVAGDAGNTVTLTMTVTSNNTCGTATATSTYSIAVDPLPTASAGGSTNICSNGSTTVSGASASNGTILWTHDGSGSLSNATTLTPTYTAVAGDAGNTITLTMTVTSNNACGTATATATYTINVAPQLSASASISDEILCNGGTANIVLTASGGTSPYSYTFDGTNNSTGVFSGISAAANIAWSVTDALSCGPVTGNLTVTEPPQLTANAAVTTAISCNGGTAIVTISASGGTGTLSYTFNGVTNSTGIFTGIVAGNNLPWSVTDDNSCGPVSGNIDVPEPTAITITSANVTTPITCNGGTGTVTIVATGGTGTLSYTFNGQTNTTGVFNNVYAGTGLSYSVTDANSCGPVYGSIDVPEPTAITASAAETTPIDCNGGTATVTITASGGTTPLSYTFDGTTNATGIFTGITARNNYAWSVTDGNSCGPVSGTISITEPVAITAAVIETSSILCFGGTADIQINAAGGTGTLHYTFDGVTNTTGTFSSITAGTYNWSVTDDNNCSPVSGTYTVTEPTDITITSIGSNSAICEGATLSLTSSASGGTGTLHYNWTGPNGYTANNAQNPSIVNATPANSGTYTLTVIDANNCSKTSTTDVTVHPSPDVIATPGSDEICSESTINISINSTVSGATFTWTVDTTDVQGAASGSGNSIAQTLTATKYTPGTATYTITPHANGCDGEPEIVTVTVNPLPDLSVTNSTTILCDNGTTSISMSSNVQGAEYKWTANRTSGSTTGFSSGSGSNVIQQTLSGAGTVEYEIISYTPNPNGCDGDTATVTIQVISTSYDLEVNTSGPSTTEYCPGDNFYIEFTGSPSGSGSGSDGNWWSWTDWEWVTKFTYTVNNSNVTANTSGGPIDDASPANLSINLINNTNEDQIAVITITPWSYYRERDCYWWWGTHCDPWPAYTQLCAGDPYEVTITVHPFFANCPADYNVNVDAGNCSATIATADPTYDCPPTTQTWTMSGATSGSGSGNVGTATFNVGTTTVTYNASDASGNSTSCSFDVTVTDDEAPVVSNCPSDFNNVPMDAGECGAVITFTEPTFTDVCDGVIAPTRTDGTGLNSGDLFPAGTTTISYSATDAAGNVGTCSFDVTVAPDNEPPVITCPFASTVTLCADAGSSFTVPGVVGDATATDNCDGVISLSYNLTGATTETGASLNNTSFYVGTTTVLWTATDINGNSASCSFDVLVNEAPGITTQPTNQTACLNGSVTFSAIASGTPAPTFQWRKDGVDISGETGSTLIINPVNAGDAANYDVVVTNGCGTITSAPATLTVTSPPVITQQPANQTDCFGSDVEFKVTAGSGDGTYNYQWQKYDGSNWNDITGATSATYLVSNIGDASNPDQSQYRVVVTDGCTQSVTSAIATLTVNQVIAQPLVTETICQGDATSFTVTTSGTSPVSYQWQLDGTDISDGGPYSGTTSQTLTITNAGVTEDGVYSAKATFNITQPNNNGAGVTTCESNFVDIADLTIDEGPDIVATPATQTICPGSTFTIVLSNNNGNSGTTYSWTRDNTTVLTGIAASGTGDTITGTLNSLDPGNSQTTTFTITATANSCESIGTATVTVIDNTDPTVNTCPGDISVNTDAGLCGAVVNYTEPTFDDDCDGSGLNGTLVAGLISGDTFLVGTTTVTYDYTDASGNGPATCSFNVTVTDNTNPTAVCQDITIELDAIGNVSITENDIDNGSSDDCGIASLVIDKTSFDCSDVGPNTVTLTVTDIYGNISTCTSTVTVEDNINPVAACKDITVQLDATGNVSITENDIDNGSTENCGIASMTVSPNTFDCSDVGPNTVTLTVVDNNSNTLTCTGIVTVEDTIKPTMICKDITVQLDGSGNTTIVAADVDNGSSDICEIASLSLDKTTFDCTETGDNTVTLTATDNNGNSATCTSVVTVEDTVAPVANCQDITVQLDAAGDATITANDINNNSTDNCNIASLSLDITTFNCTNLGANTVTLTVTDDAGNTDDCTATVTVADDTNPVDITVTGVTQTPIDCYGELATVTIATTGGVGALTYTFNGISNNSGIFDNVAAGTNYNWDVTDALGCSTPSGTFDVVEPDELTATIDNTDVTCSTGNDGTITITNSAGGSGSYEYSNDGGTNWQTASTFTGLVPGTYNVQMRDATTPSCVVTLDAALDVFILTADVMSENVTCNGAADGLIEVSNPDGGSGSFEVSINGTNWYTVTAATPYTFSSLAPATYTVQIRDANDITCVITLDVIDITEFPALAGTVSSTDVDCNGADNGTITISPVSGGSGSYEYTINGGTSWEAAGTYTSLSPNTYDVRIRDANEHSCELTLDGALVITEPNALWATATPTNVSCNGGNDGAINITLPAGGSGSYEYSIDGGTTWQASGNFPNLDAGAYDVYIRDANATGCVIVLNSPLDITEPPALTFTGQPADVTICDGSTTSFNVNTSGGVGTIHYRWQNDISGSWSDISNGGIFSGATTNTITLTGVTSTFNGNYRVIISDDCSSDTSDVAILIVNEITAVNPATDTSKICEGENFTFNVTTAGTSPVNYQWQVNSSGTWVNVTNNGIISGATTNQLSFTSATPNENGQYKVIVTFNESGGSTCTLDSETDFFRYLLVYPTPTIDDPGDQAFCNQAVTDAVPLTGSPSGVVFDITGGTAIGLADQTGVTEIPAFTSNAGTATITITPRANGCTGNSIDIEITISPTPTVTAPIGVTFCNGELTSQYDLTGTPANVVYDFTGGSAIGLADTTGVSGGIPPFNATEGVATVTVTPNVGGCVGVPVNFDITVLPTPTAIISGSDTVCLGSLAPNLVFSNPHNIIVKAYYDINGAGSNSINIPANSTATISVPTNVSGTFNYNLLSAEYFVEPFCVNSNITGTATVVVIDPPVPTITGPDEMCAGTAGNVYKTEHSMSNYIWSVSAGGTITAGGTATDSTITVTWTSSGTKNIGVIYDNSNGCSAASATVYPVTVNQLPVPTITGAATACEGETDVVYTTQSGMTNYTWTVSAGGTITAGGGVNDNTATVTWNSAGAQTISVNYTNSNGCSTGTPTVNTVTVNPTPTPTLTGDNTACSGTAGHVYTTEAGMTNYVWTVSAGGSITSGGTFNDNTATVTWNSAGTQTISVNYENGSGCSALTDVVNNVTVEQSPNPTITGNTTTCAGTSVTYSTETGMSNYDWVVSSGGTITAGGAATDDFVTVLWNNTGNETVSVDYQNGTGCNAPSPTIKDITVNPEVVPTISGINSVCNGESQVYTTQTGMSQYVWTVVGGTITAGGTNGDHTATVTWNTDGTQTISVNYLNNTGCTSVTTDFDVTVNPIPTPSITGNTTPCLDGNAVHYTSETGMTDYQWIVTSGGVITGGGSLSDDYADVTWNTAGNTSITLNYTNASGCRSTTATQLDITVFDLPAVTCPADMVVCVNTAPFALSGGTPAGGVYSGTGVSGGNFDPGTAGIGTHTISYTYTDANSCPNTCTFDIAVDPVPSASTQTMTVCSNDSVNINLRDIIPGATFTWVATNPSGATVTGYNSCNSSCDTIIKDILVNTSHDQPEGPSGTDGVVRYRVTPTANGCTGNPFNINVTVRPDVLTYDLTWNSNFVEDFIEVCAGEQALSSNDIEIINPNTGSILTSYTYFSQGGNWNPTFKYGPTPEGPWTDAPGYWNNGEGPYQWAVDLSINNRLGYHYFIVEVTDPATGCVKISNPAILHVVSSLVVEAGGPDFLCSSSTPTPYTLSGAYVGGISATGGNWTANVGGGSFVQNYSNPAAATYRPPANYVGDITLTLTSNDPDGGGVCVSLIDTRTLTLLEPNSFDGCVDPSTWTLNLNNSNGYIDNTGPPCFATLVGSDNGSGTMGATDITHCTGAGTVSFDWSLSTPANKIVWHTEDQQSGYRSGNNMIVSRPTNISAGDLIIVSIHIDNNVGTINSPGFTSIRNTHGTSATVATFYKIATASEPASYTFVTSGGVSSNDRIFSSRITGHNTANPIGASSGVTSYLTYPSGMGYMTLSIPGVNTTSANSMLVALMTVDMDSEDYLEYANSPIGMDALYYENNETAARVASQTIENTGATGNRDFTWPSFHQYNRTNMHTAGQLFVINPATLDVDAAVFILNGTADLLGSTNGASGSYTTSVNSGDDIAFGVLAEKNIGGPGRLTIYNLVMPNDAPGLTGITDTIVPDCQLPGYSPTPVPPTVIDDCGTATIKTGYPTVAESGGTCAGSKEWTWIYVDDCGVESDTFTQTFTWTVKNDIVLNCPHDTSLAACVSGAEIQAAYDTWKAGFTTSGGCGLITDNLHAFPLLPDLTCGGELEFKYIVSDDCGDIDSCTSKFTVAASTDLAVTAPRDTTLSACSDSTAIKNACDLWVAGFTKTGGCASVTDNLADIPALGDLTCGGQLSFTLVADYSTTGCVFSVDTSSVFTVEVPEDLEVVVPDDVSLPLCSDSTTIRNAYDTWAAGFSTTGGCSVTTNIADIPALGDLVCGGQLSFTFTADNGEEYCTDHDEKTSTFTVTDAPPLTISCPADPNIAGCSGAIAVTNAYNNWVDGFTASGGCDVQTNIDEVPPLNDMVCNGQLSFTFIAINGEGVCADTAECTQTFTIGTSDPLSVSCPNDTTVEGCTTADVQSAFDAWISQFGYTGGCNVTATDTSFYSPPATCGSELTINYIASDECGNADSCSATFRVEAPLLTATAPSDNVQAACQTQAEVDVAFAAWKNLFTYSGGCNVSETDLSGFTPPDVCGGSVVVNYTATGACGQVENASAFFTIDAPNNVLQEPTFTVPNDTTIYTDADCNYNADSTITGKPTDIADNCTNINNLVVSHSDSIVAGSCEGSYVIYRKWSVVDNCSNVTTKTQIITVQDNTPPAITCPADASENADAGLCTKTGLTLGTATATDNCTPDAQITITNNAPDPFPVGTTVVTWTATDDCGNSSTCSQNVTVIDVTPPAILMDSCIDVTENASPNNCSKSPVSIPNPVYSDDCYPVDSLTLTWTMTGATTGSGSGFVKDSTFNVGVTTVIYTVTDPGGLTDQCLFTVTIVDVTPPNINITGCQPVQETAASDSCSKTTVTINNPVYSDDCWPHDSLTLTWVMTGATTGSGVGSVAGETFNVGVTNVEYTVTDPDGNFANCDFDVTIIHLEIPPSSFTCPADTVYATPTAGNCDADVTLGTLTVNDPCNEIDSVWNESPFRTSYADASGNYPVGITDFTWYISDISGNIDSCQVTVIVNDLQPTLNCPADITVPADFGENFASNVTVPPPTFDDNCPDSTLTWQMTLPDLTVITSPLTGINIVTSPGTFNVGVTTIEYTFTDANGNQVVCDFTITVEAEPIIDCPPDTTIYLGAAGCTDNFDPGIPDLISGAAPIDWTWVMTGATTGSGATNDATPLPDSPGNTTFNVGTTTIRWTAENLSGADTCFHLVTVVDTIPPTFTTAPFEDCVDYLFSAIYAPLNPDPVEGNDPNLIKNPSPDYRTFPAGDTSLDILTLDDNCCDSASMTIHWRIDFTPTPNNTLPAPHVPYLSFPPISGTGQPSTYGSDIHLHGDGVLYQPVVHTITYWVVDCHDNRSPDHIETITINPRPLLIKMN